MTLKWSAPAEHADSVTGYEVLRAVGQGELATLAADTGSTDTAYTDAADTGSTSTAYTDATATEAGETYAYAVKAIRGEDRSQGSGQAQVQVPHDPVDLAPTGLSAVIFTVVTVGEEFNAGVGLTWSAPAEDADSVTGYEVLRAVGDGEPTTLVADTESTVTTYTDATATTAGETYAYQVKAIRDGVRSQASAEASVALPVATVSTCEFDAGGSDLPADTNTACALAVGGSVRGERGAADDVDWYRVGLQASATYQFDMRGKSTGEWQLVDGVPAFVSVGTLEDPRLLGIYDASGALVAGSDSELAGTGKDSRIASFSPDAAGVYYISASAESGWTGTYELSLTVTVREHDLTSLAPGGLAVGMVRNRLNLSWTAPAADAESVTGYEILRAEGEAEPATLVADTQSTATTYRDDTATTAGVSYTYAVKALRGDEASVESGRASYSLPAGYTASTKEAASKVFAPFEVSGETLKFALGNTQFVVQPDQDPEVPFTIWSGEVLRGFFQFSVIPTNAFIYNEVDYNINYISITEGDSFFDTTIPYYSYYPQYEDDLNVAITPPIGMENIAAWKFVTPDGEFAFADAVIIPYNNGLSHHFRWPGIEWVSRSRTSVSITGLPGTDGPEPVVDTKPGIKLSWNTRTYLAFRAFESIPTKVGFTIHRSQRNEWGNYGSGQQQVGEVLKCDIAESGGAQSCLTIGTSGSFVPESWTWTDETAERGVSYLYTIKPYHEFYSGNGSTVWNGDLAYVVNGMVPEPAHRLRIYGQSSNVSHGMPHPEAPGTPTNLKASQSGSCTGSCVRLTWNAAPNATKYVVFRTGQRTRETWVDYGLTYPQRRFGDPDLTATEWEDTSAEAGVNYGYRVAAFNEDGLRNATDAVVGFETPGGTTVPNRVRGLSAEAALKDRVKNTGATVAGDQSLNTSTRERFAQRFKTGGNTGKVRLRSIAVKFGEIQNVSTAPDVLEATVIRSAVPFRALRWYARSPALRPTSLRR